MIDKKTRYNNFYMDIALRCASMSHAIRKQVGCVIVKDGSIISMGWNGTPAGMNNCCENALADGTLVTKPEVSHAEENALMKLAKSTMSADGSTAYVTLEPCIHCSKLLYNAGVRTVYYREAYREPIGTNFLKSLGVIVEQV